MKAIRLEEQSPDGIRKTVGVISTETVVGRDPGQGLKVERGSISRRHGIFFSLGQNWCYRDLGSTNGSWHNGKPLKKDQVCLVRPGDRLQLADTFLVIFFTDQAGVRSWEDDGNQVGSLVVFSEGLGINEFRISENGQALVAGSAGANLLLPGYSGGNPRFVVESKEGEILLHVWELRIGDPITYVVSLNGKQVSGTIRLDDRDEISCGTFIVLVNRPRAKAATSGFMSTPASSTFDPPVITPQIQSENQEKASRQYTTELPKGAIYSGDIGALDSGAMRKRSPSTTFGQVMDLEPDDSSVDKMDRMLGPQLRGGALASANRRFPTGAVNPFDNVPSFSDKLLALLGFLMLLGVVTLIVWYVIFS